MTEKQKTEAVGLIAGFLTTSSFLPQTWKLWRMLPHATPDLSLEMYVVIVLGTACWVAYGVLLRARAIILWNVVSFVLTMSVLIYKLMYG